jgi:hypothetical protein
MKMNCIQKEKLEKCKAYSLQWTSKICTEESAVALTDGYKANSLEKRKKLCEPIYLKRI